MRLRVLRADTTTRGCDRCSPPCSDRRRSWHWPLLRATAVILSALVVLGLSTGSAQDNPPASAGEVLQLGTSDLVLTATAQPLLTLVESSEYDCDRSIIVIEEPHFDAQEQWTLYQGLTALLADNPEVVADCVFLGEGLGRGTSLSVAELVDAAPDPLPETILIALRSFLIPAYVAVEWRQELDIAILGVEDRALYAASAELWEQQGNDDDWLLTVTARNRSMAETALQQVDEGKLVFLFLGGRHLTAIEEDVYSSAMANLSGLDDAELAGGLREAENLGVIDYLRERGVGYHYLTAMPPPGGLVCKGEWILSGDSGDIYPRGEELYRELFRAQRRGEYEDYFQRLIEILLGEGADWGGDADPAVTVAPAPAAAAQFLVALSAASEGQQSEAGEQPEADQQKDTGKKHSPLLKYWNSLWPFKKGIRWNGKGGKKAKYFVRDKSGHGTHRGQDEHLEVYDSNRWGEKMVNARTGVEIKISDAKLKKLRNRRLKF